MKKALISIALVILFLITILVSYVGFAGSASEYWILCKPGAIVNVRRAASKTSEIVGYLEVDDTFKSDGQIKNGFLHVLDVGEYGDGWVYSGFVSTEDPEAVFENYVVVARVRAACRRWCEGPQIAGRLGWIYNGSEIQVFYMTSEWAVTSRGYIRSEWLEVSP